MRAEAGPFASPTERREAATLGMWVFLSSEVMLFGALVLALTVYRTLYPPAFAAASHRLEFWLGTANTAVLLTSSLAVALAGRASRAGGRWAVTGWLLAAVALGGVFLGLKGLEYYHHYEHHLVPGPGFEWAGDAPHAMLFFYLYFLVTGLHALHLAIGMAVLSWIAFGRKPLGVELAGLYWHLVDVVWVFLYPLFYLVGHR